VSGSRTSDALPALACSIRGPQAIILEVEVGDRILMDEMDEFGRAFRGVDVIFVVITRRQVNGGGVKKFSPPMPLLPLALKILRIKHNGEGIVGRARRRETRRSGFLTSAGDVGMSSFAQINFRRREFEYTGRISCTDI